MEVSKIDFKVNLELQEVTRGYVTELLYMREKESALWMRFHVPNNVFLVAFSLKGKEARTQACELGLQLIGFALDLLDLNN